MKKRNKIIASVLGSLTLGTGITVAAVAQACSNESRLPDLTTTLAVEQTIRTVFTTSPNDSSSGLVNYDSTDIVSSNAAVFLDGLQNNLNSLNNGNNSTITSLNNFLLNSASVTGLTTFSVSLNNFSGTTNDGFLWQSDQSTSLFINGAFEVIRNQSGAISEVNIINTSDNPITVENLAIANNTINNNLNATLTALSTLTTNSVNNNLNTSLQTVLQATSLDVAGYRFSQITSSFANARNIEIISSENSITINFLVNFSGSNVDTVNSTPRPLVYFGQNEQTSSNNYGSVVVAVANGIISGYTWTNVIDTTEVVNTAIVNPLTQTANGVTNGLATYRANEGVPTANTASSTLLTGLTTSLTSGGTDIDLEYVDSDTASLSSSLTIRSVDTGGVTANIINSDYFIFSTFDSLTMLNTLEIIFNENVIFFGQAAVGNTSNSNNATNIFGFERNVGAAGARQTTTISNIAYAVSNTNTVLPIWNGFVLDPTVDAIFNSVSALSAGINLFPSDTSNLPVSLLTLLNNDSILSSNNPRLFINSVSTFNVNRNNVRIRITSPSTTTNLIPTYELVIGAIGTATEGDANRIILTTTNVAQNGIQQIFGSAVNNQSLTGITISNITFNGSIVNWAGATISAGSIVLIS